jgi:hypothetical protein
VLGTVLGDEQVMDALGSAISDVYAGSSSVSQSEMLGVLPAEILVAALTAGAGEVAQGSGALTRLGKALGEFTDAMRAIEVRSPLIPVGAAEAGMLGIKGVRNPIVRLGTLERGDINANIVGGVPDGYAGHHLITVDDANNFPVMRRAAALGYDINRGTNGIALPTIPAEALRTGLPLHSGRHLAEYTDLVRNELGRLQTRYALGRIDDTRLISEITRVENRIRAQLTSNQVRLQSTDPRPRN